jgi:hypothetical protein
MGKNQLFLLIYKIKINNKMAREKGINKAKVGFSIDLEIEKKFGEYCDDNNINKSKLINKIIKNFLDNLNK